MTLSRIEKYLFLAACIFLLFVTFKTKLESYNLMVAFQDTHRELVLKVDQQRARIERLEQGRMFVIPKPCPLKKNTPT